jgi:hypothetical protein
LTCVAEDPRILALVLLAAFARTTQGA